MGTRRLELDEREIEVIGDYLVTQPWAKVNGLITKLQMQCNDQEFQGEVAALRERVKRLEAANEEKNADQTPP